MPEPKQGPASAAPAAESLSAILAEFRAFALRAAGEGRTICPESVLLLADKAEAAVRRERVEREFAHKKVEEALSDEISIRDEKIKRSAPGNALRPVELHPFHWGATTVRHVCAKCLKDIEEYIGTAKHGADSTAIRDNVRRFLDLFTPGTIHPAGTMERLLREARAAIGDGAP